MARLLARDGDVVRQRGDGGAQRPEDLRRRLDVGGLQDVGDARFAARQRREDERAVRDRFVAGNADGAAQSQWRQRSHASSAVARSVFSSRYFTITGVWSESACSLPHADVTPRAPGTTT